MTRVGLSVEGILIWCSRMISDLDTTRMPGAIIVDVEVRCFVEPVGVRMHRRLCEVIMEVCKTDFGQRCLP